MFRIHRSDGKRGSTALLRDREFPKRRTPKLVAVLFLLTATHGAITWAQTFGGSIRGTIMDPSGASIAAANVTMEEVNTGLKWKFASSSTGLYSAPRAFPSAGIQLPSVHGVSRQRNERTSKFREGSGAAARHTARHRRIELNRCCRL